MRLEDLAGRPITLLGVGVETLTVLPHLRAAGVGRVTVVEPGTITDAQRGALVAAGVTGGDVVDTVPRTGDVVLRSPGFGRHRTDVEALASSSRIMTTPTGLWLALRGGAGTVVVTGTKGKSTTTTLIRDELARRGVEAHLAGNIGTSAWDLDPHIGGVVVLELSSYHGADLLASGEIAVLTMMSADHLDWHGSTERYQRDKLRVLTTPQANGQPPATLLALDVQSLPTPIAERVTRITAHGDHRARNVALAAAAVNAALEALGRQGVEVGELTESLTANYPSLASRFEPVATINGVTYIDDALASNPTATAAGLESLRPGPVALICGGHDRSVSLAPMLAELSRWPTGSVTVVWLGADADQRRIALASLDAVSSALPTERMSDAVILASLVVEPGATVIFSPMAPTERSEGTWVDRAAAFHRAVALLESDASSN